jgi:hypothetical protein
MEFWPFEFSKIPKSAHESRLYGKNSEIRNLNFRTLSQVQMCSLFSKTRIHKVQI